MFANTESASAQNNLLWEITGNKLEKPSYLFGTIHYYNKKDMALPDTLYRLIDRCEEIAFELNFETMATDMMKVGIMIKDTNETLDKIMKPALYKQLMSLCDSVTFLKPMKGTMKYFKPFVVSTYLYMPGDMKQTGLVDMELYQYAAGKSKKTSGLETIEEQMQAVNNMGLKDQIDVFLENAIIDFPVRDQILQEMVEVYKTQNLELLLKEAQKGDLSGSLADEIVTKRNYVMADRAEKIMKNGAFVGVGAAHLGGEDGIINILRSRGYTLRAVQINFTTN